MTAPADHDPSIQRALSIASIPTPDPEHSRHVAHLSLQLFDQLAEPLGLSADSRDYLAAAALWHDVGRRKSERDHHKASFDLIRAEFLHGFEQHEKLIIAAAARYHRQHAPSFDHPGYRDLSRARRLIVEQIAALLRLAEALDASHLQLVEGVECAVSEHQVSVVVVADNLPMSEIEAARARSGLFRAQFKRDIVFTWKPSGSSRPVERD